MTRFFYIIIKKDTYDLYFRNSKNSISGSVIREITPKIILKTNLFFHKTTTIFSPINRLLND